MIEDIDYLGREWGKWMRYQPNGWYRKNHVTKENYEKYLMPSGHSYARIAVTSDSLSMGGGQKSYTPQKLEKKLKLGPDNWQISASGPTAAVYGALRKNPSGGRINNFRIYRSKILIKRFMPEDALRFRRGLENLKPEHQNMLCAHYVLVVVSPSKLQELRERKKLTCYQVTYKQKLELLQTTSNQYPKWLGLSRRKIEATIIKTDADCLKRRMSLKKRMAQESARLLA